MTEMPQEFVADGDRMSSSEIPFHVGELFFSRTDHRAVIQSGNSVFQRLAGYDWDELIGAPHKLIRHPDMPRALFQTLFDVIKAGRPMGFYVKNRDKMGRYYWVFSIVVPVEGGYLSTRLKPSSGLLPEIARLYADILHLEQQDGLSPQDSSAALIQRVRDLGYPSYEAFQSNALARELESRAKKLNGSLDQVQKRFLTMSRGIEQVLVETNELKDALHAIRTVPMNMRIIASRLENAGGPISAISVNYSQMLEEMNTWVKTFVDGDDCVFASIRRAILTGQFLANISALKSELRTTLLEDAAAQSVDGFDMDGSLARIDQICVEYSEQTTRALSEVENAARRFARSVLDMKRYVTGLSSTRMMCKIESASLNNSGTALSGIVDQLDACQDEIEKRLAKVVDLNSAIQGNTSMLRALM